MDGVAVGSLYALIALGYTMVYGILQFINFAHSDVFVLGAWVSYTIAVTLGYAAANAEPSVFAGLLILFICTQVELESEAGARLFAPQAQARQNMPRVERASQRHEKSPGFKTTRFFRNVGIGLTLIGLDFAIVFAVLTALVVVVPYIGVIVGAIPPVLFALTISPGKALLVLIVYVAVHEIEASLIIPLVMARTTKLHPALIAVGVVVVGELFGIIGLIVAVPIIATIAILTDELWVKEIETAHARKTAEAFSLREPRDALEAARATPDEVEPEKAEQQATASLTGGSVHPLERDR